MRETKRKGFLMITFTVALLLLVIVQLLGPVLLASSDTLAISNGSFETTETLNASLKIKKPKNWLSEDFNIHNNISEDYAVDGTRSVKISAKKTLTVSSDFEVRVASGKLYRLGVKTYSEEAKTASVKIIVTDVGTDNWVASPAMPVMQANVWGDAYVEFQVPDNVSKIKISCIVDATNATKSVYIDGFYANVIESKVNVVTVDDGASLRLTEKNPGLRFSGKVDKVYYDGYSETCAGIIIVPRDYLETESEFTIAQLNENKKTFVNIEAKQWNNDDTADVDGFYGFSCALVNILDININREFCARSYFKYNDGGVEKIVYSSFSFEQNSRSIQQVAKKAKETLDSYNEKEQQIILHYADYVEPAKN